MADSLNDIAQRIANAQAGGSRYPFLNEEGIGDVVVTDYGFENTRQIGQVFNIYVRVLNWQPTKPGAENEIAPGAMRTVQVKMKNDNANSLLKEFALGVTQGLAYAATATSAPLQFLIGLLLLGLAALLACSGRRRASQLAH